MDAVLRALADGTRRHILALVWRQERTAGQIAAEFLVSRPAISQHLRVLLTSELITIRRAGTRLSSKGVIIEREIVIAASQETVFGFLVDGALMAQWFGLSHTLEPRPGGLFRVECGRGNVALGRYTGRSAWSPCRVTWGGSQATRGETPASGRSFRARS